MNLQYSGEPGSSLELEETVPTLEKLRHPKRIPVKCRQRNRFIPAFLIGVAVLSLVSLLYLGIDWGKMASRIPDIGVVFWDLAHLDFSNMDLIFSSLVETVSIAVLSLLYSLVLGVVFGMLAARNVFRVPVLSVATQALFTFLRAVPTPVRSRNPEESWKSHSQCLRRLPCPKWRTPKNWSPGACPPRPQSEKRPQAKWHSRRCSSGWHR